ncbi:MAG: hypothetical protein RI924_781 [Bacteroidota bacterium]|jgi:histidinol-phosphate aminotransferase
MINIESLVRPNIRALKPYSSAREEYTGTAGIFLDANENPNGTWNRYPDPYQMELKKTLSALKSVPMEHIFIGNGSDEVIDLAFRIFCTPGQDKALTFSPTYGMYEVSAGINEVTLIKLPLDENFQIDFEGLDQLIGDPNLKLIFICSPNNPTGNMLNHIDRILKQFKGMVIIDEAYIDFSNSVSWAQKIGEYPNLMVMQTLSKAYGMAALRLGIAFAQPAILSYFNKVKPPYNISQVNQETALALLADSEKIWLEKEEVIKQREFLRQELLKISGLVIKIFPSDANFLLVEVTDADRIYQRLLALEIVTRNRNTQVPNAIRITVGTAAENQQLIKALKQIAHEKDFIY